MNRYTFDDLKEGLTESFEAEITEDMMSSFLKITGDINPLHNDDAFAKKKGFRERVVYGMLSASLISTLGGVYLPGENCLIHSVEANFVKPVFIGDRLTVQGTVEKVNSRFGQVEIKVQIFNQDGTKVVRGKLKAGVIDG